MGLVYVLQLKARKWYIGYTERDSIEKILEHVDNNAIKWITKYPPLEKEYLHYVSEFGYTRKDEYKLTLEFMRKYGMLNVRGSKWSMVKMPNYLVNELNKLIGKNMEKPTSKSKNTNKSNKPSINENLFAKGWKYDENEMLTRNDAIDLKSANIDIKNEIKAPFEKKKSFHERKLNAINKKPLSLKDKPYTAKKKSPSRRKKG
jgi:predicted GIY-YIG superfamily endonuclease